MISFEDFLDFSKKSKQIQSRSSSRARVTDEDKFSLNMQGVSTNDNSVEQNGLNRVKKENPKFVPPVLKDTKHDEKSERAHLLKVLNNNKPKNSKYKNSKAPASNPSLINSDGITSNLMTPEVLASPALTSRYTTVPLTTSEPITVSVATPDVLTPPENMTAPVITSKVTTNPIITPHFNPLVMMSTQEVMISSVVTQDTEAEEGDSSNLEPLEDEDQKNIKDAGVVCNLCNKSYVNLKYLKRHIKRKHLKVPNVCSECSKVYPTEKTLNKHFLNVHVKHECKFCKHIFKNANVLRSHMSKCKVRKETPEIEFQCSDCKKGLKTEKALNEHVAKFHIQETCKYCERIFQCKENLRTHQYKCKTKKAAFNHDEGAGKTVATGKDISTEKTGSFEKICDLCQMKFNSKGGYYKHKNKIHKDNIVISDVGQVIIFDTLVETPSNSNV